MEISDTTVVNKQTITSGVIGAALIAAIMATQIPTESATADKSNPLLERGQIPVVLEIPSVLVNVYTLDQLDSTIINLDNALGRDDLTDDTRTFLMRERERISDIRNIVIKELDK